MEEKQHRMKLPRLNLRPFFVIAVGLICGMYLSYRITLAQFRAVDVLPFALFLLFLLPPFSIRRICAVCALFLLVSGVGAGLFLHACRDFERGYEDGKYTVTGTVERVTHNHGYSIVTLSSLWFDADETNGKMLLTLPDEEVLPGDVISFCADVSKNLLPERGESCYYLASDLRYRASPSEYERTGRSKNIFLRANAALYDVLHANMDTDAADMAYALLTGNTSEMDDGLLQATRTGGIAHIFAVSGLHIGILYGAATLCMRPLFRRWSFLPALLLAGGYTALCRFSVSAVRAFIMCAAAGLARFTGRKYDLLSAAGLSAAVTLLASPAPLLSVSFQLSYGAVAGLGLFSNALTRVFSRRLPQKLAQALAASVSVQLFTFPFLLETFGYFSLWGTLLNLVVIPALPVLFLPLIVCGFLSALFPVAAPVILALPQGLICAVTYLFSAADLSAVLSGFSLGTGALVFFASIIVLSQRVRLRVMARGAMAAVLSCAFVFCVTMENVVAGGCRIDVAGRSGGDCALIRSEQCAVLVVDGDVSLSYCKDFLSRTYAGELNAVVLLSSDPADAVNVAAFLPTKAIYLPVEVPTGLRERDVCVAQTMQLGAMQFRYTHLDRLVLTVEDVTVEFSFEREALSFADLSLETGETRLKYLLKDGIIMAL